MRRTGDAFEERACAHLKRAGLRLIKSNFHTRFGEIDLIMRDGDTLVFVEVRFRRSNAFGDARASVSATKRQRLIRAAEGFLAAHPKLAEQPCRFDIVAFDGAGTKATAHWHRHAFEAL